MTKLERVGSIRKIAKYTFVDDVRQRSFVVMFAMLVVVVLLSRGCYHGNYMINGRPIDTGTVVGTVSQATFHIISIGVMLIAALLSMRLLKRDGDDGMQSSILSKPIARWQYIVGKVLGIWFLTALFMFALHFIVFLIASLALKIIVPGYLIASALASSNLLFVVIAVLLFTLLMPDIVAVLCLIGIGIVGLVSDGLYALSQTQIAQMMLQQPGVRAPSDMTFWKIIYFVWPKMAGTERFASSFVDGSFSPALIYPFINILFYCLILGSLLLLKFKKQEIT